jgi:hypothetical protein
MKSQRRHELQHNELAQWLINTIEVLKPYQNLILAVVVAIVVALGAYKWWSWTATAQTTQAWNDLNAALIGGNIDRLAKVPEDYPGTTAARVATVLQADFRLAGGCDQLFVNKAPAEEQLSKAIELYRSDMNQDDQSELIERAVFGLARARESKGELDAANRSYQDVVKNWPHGAYSAAAQQRIDDLKRTETKRMYDDFASFDPKPVFHNEPVLPGLEGLNTNSLPKDKPAGFPAGPDELKSGGSTKDSGVQKSGTPAQTTKPGTNAKSAPSKKPAGEKSGK